MTKYYNALRALVNQDMISQASTTVGESSSNVSNAVSKILSGLLGVMLKKGDTPQIKNILEEAGNLNILLRSDNIWEEKPTVEQQAIGDDFLQHLLGDEAADFTDPIAEDAHISKVATNRLVSMVAPIFAGYLGNKMVKENRTLSQILSEIGAERDLFAKNIPVGVIKAFGLSSVLGDYAPAAAKKGTNWIIWLIALVILLLLLFLGWRSCMNKNVEEAHNNRAVVTDTISRNRVNNQPQTTARTAIENRDTSHVVLPNGVRLAIYDNGVEKQMVDYLNSEDYKKATEKDLKEKWFQFDNIEFEFGSATELKEGSKAQLNNIIEILKAYKNAKVKVAGFADKRGSEEANMEISQKRAKTVEALLEKGGVGSQVVKTEGYGDEYAKYSAKDPEEKRAKDRDIALRFVK